MSKVNIDTIKPWIAQRVTDLLGLEDDVVVEFVYNQLEEKRVINIDNIPYIFIFYVFVLLYQFGCCV